MFAKPAVRDSGLLDVGSGQQLYWEESGRLDGIPVLYLHGGPGGTLGSGGYRTKFDPRRFRIVGIDQRGCGRSRPLAVDPAHDLAANTTQTLIEDCERLRRHLGIDRWMLNGVSWGSTLALAYAQMHPDRITAVVLMAVTTTSRFEIDWITEHVGAIFPEAWDRFARYAARAGLAYRPPGGRLVEVYAALLRSDDPAVREEASRAWADWEDHHVSLLSGVHPHPRWDDPAFRQVFATLTTHFWAHDGFLDPPILDRMDRLDGIPAVLIHGRADVSGPLVTAWRVHQRWPGSQLIIDEGEGHGGPRMIDAWVDANSRLADRLRGDPSGTL